MNKNAVKVNEEHWPFPYKILAIHSIHRKWFWVRHATSQFIRIFIDLTMKLNDDSTFHIIDILHERKIDDCTLWDDDKLPIWKTLALKITQIFLLFYSSSIVCYYWNDEMEFGFGGVNQGACASKLLCYTLYFMIIPTEWCPSGISSIFRKCLCLRIVRS